MILQAIGPSRMGELLQGDPSSLVFILNDEFVGSAMTLVLQLLMVTSFFAGVLALQNVSSRYLLALGKARILPEPFARLSRRTQAPSTGNLVHVLATMAVLIVFAAVGADPYTQVIPWTNSPTIVGVLVMQILTSIAVVAYFRKNHRGEHLWHRLIAPVLSCFAVAAALVLLITGMGSLTRLDPLGNSILFIPMILAFCFAIWRYRTLARKGATTEMIAAVQE